MTTVNSRKVLLIDDLRSFKDTNNAQIIRTSDEALKWLENISSDFILDELWLDHDLGENKKGEVTSIIPFVHKLEELAFFGNAPEIKIIYIHTSNPVGGRAIEAALKRFYRTKRVYAGDYFIT